MILRFASIVLLAFVIRSPLFVSGDSEAEENASVVMNLVEFELEDQCANTADAFKDLYLNENGAINNKIFIDIENAKFQKEQIDEVSNFEDIDEYSKNLKRRIELLTKIGDNLLPESDIAKIIRLNDKTQGIKYSKNICEDDKCGMNYDDVLRTFASSRDADHLKKTWNNWNKNFQVFSTDFVEVLNLLSKSATVNGFDTVTGYWEMLAEYPGAYQKAKSLWEEIEPLYLKLHDFVKKRLAYKYAFTETEPNIPVYLLGSLYGDDWSNLAEFILPHPNVYNEITTGLKSKKIGGGKHAYFLAQNMTNNMGLGKFNDPFWKNSQFGSDCPTHVLDYCQSGNVEVLTCDNSTWSNFLEAHEIGMHVVHKNLAAKLEDNSFLLREGNRISPVYEAISGLGSLMAVHSHHLHVTGMVPLTSYAESEHQYDAKMTLLLLTALHVLPRLPYYLAADMWRIEHQDVDTADDVVQNWWDAREKYQHVSGVNTSWDFISDAYMSKNKPYIGKFLGTFLQFQILDYLQTGKDIDSDLVMHVKEYPEFKELLKSGMSDKWPTLLQDYLYIDDISSTQLLTYFKPLEDYMRRAPFYPIIAKPKLATTTTLSTVAADAPFVKDSYNDTNEDTSHNTTTSKTLETSVSKSIDSNHLIGIGIFVIVCVALLAAFLIISRKRRQHKKQLEKDRNNQP